MNAWKDNTDTNKRMNLIGDTRWWAKDVALTKIFGNFEDSTQSLYVELLMTMEEIRTSNVGNHSSNAYQAQNFITNLTSFETILMSKIFLRIFAITTPLSKYLQTVGLDILTASRMVSATLTNLKSIRNDFNTIKQQATTFVNWANKKLDLKECDIIVSDSFKMTRIRRKKKVGWRRLQRYAD